MTKQIELNQNQTLALKANVTDLGIKTDGLSLEVNKTKNSINSVNDTVVAFQGNTTSALNAFNTSIADHSHDIAKLNQTVSDLSANTTSRYNLTTQANVSEKIIENNNQSIDTINQTRILAANATDSKKKLDNSSVNFDNAVTNTTNQTISNKTSQLPMVSSKPRNKTIASPKMKKTGNLTLSEQKENATVADIKSKTSIIKSDNESLQQNQDTPESTMSSKSRVPVKNEKKNEIPSLQTVEKHPESPVTFKRIWNGSSLPADFEEKTKFLSPQLRKSLKEFYQGAELPYSIIEYSDQLPEDFKSASNRYYQEVFKLPPYVLEKNNFSNDSWKKFKNFFTTDMPKTLLKIKNRVLGDQRHNNNRTDRNVNVQ